MLPQAPQLRRAQSAVTPLAGASAPGDRSPPPVLAPPVEQQARWSCAVTAARWVPVSATQLSFRLDAHAVSKRMSGRERE